MVKGLLPRNNLALYMGWRLWRSRNPNAFVSFISFSSILGVALGVSVLILVLSAMNGFERELRDRLLAVVPHGELTAIDSPIVDWQAMAQEAMAERGVSAAAPFVVVEGLLSRGDVMKPIQLRGVLPDWEQQVSGAKKFMTEQAWQSLSIPSDSVVLGKPLAEALNVEVGDKVKLLVSRNDGSRLSVPKTVVFSVAGLFDLGGEVDKTIAFTHLDKAAEVLGLREGVSGIRIKAESLFDAPALIRKIGFAQSHPLYITDWTRTQGHLYSDIQLIKTLTYLVLVLVVSVASFNIICSLIMSVRDKQGEIAILRTMGMSRRGILTSFMVQGSITGAMGVTLGAGMGSLLGWKLPQVMAWLESVFGVSFLSGDIYFIDFLPSELHFSDVLAVTILAFCVTLVASWYPAWKASRLHPAEALSN